MSPTLINGCHYRTLRQVRISHASKATTQSQRPTAAAGDRPTVKTKRSIGVPLDAQFATLQLLLTGVVPRGRGPQFWPPNEVHDKAY